METDRSYTMGRALYCRRSRRILASLTASSSAATFDALICISRFRHAVVSSGCVRIAEFRIRFAGRANGLLRQQACDDRLVLEHLARFELLNQLRDFRTML